MEQGERDKIAASLPKLIELIDCNSKLVSNLRATKTIGLADECHLDTFANKLDRSKELLNLLCTRVNGYQSLVVGLRNTNQTGALKVLGEPVHVGSTQLEFEGSPSSQLAEMRITAGSSSESEICTIKQFPFHSEEATQLFTGRGTELDILLETLLADGGTASITGIGGIGKTELAKVFLHKLDEDVFKQIIWINCESSFTTTSDFIRIAKDYLRVPILNSSGRQRDTMSIVNDVYEKLQKSKSLIILDNVETKEIFHMYLPRTSKKSILSTLVTSQSLKYGTNIPLDSLDLPEAVEFVKKGLNIPEPLSKEFENGILELVKRLETLPLAIIQAIGYIKEKREMHLNYGPHDYLVDLDRIPQRIFDRNSFPDLSLNGKTIYKTLDLSLSRIEACEASGRLASEILSKVAFMAPDNIPSTLFSELAKSDVDAIEEALVLIGRYSIIKYTPVDGEGTVYFSIHRLVQDVLRIRIEQNNQTESSIRSTMQLLRFHLHSGLVDHSVVALYHANKIQNLLELFSDFPYEITAQMWKMGRISDACDFSASSLILVKQKLSIKGHARTIFWLQSYNNWLLSLQGKLDESIEKLKSTFDEAKKFLPDSHTVILKIQYFIARVYYESGQNDKSALICDKMCKKYKLHQSVPLTTLYEIALLQNVLKRFEDAQKTTKYILSHLHLHSVEGREMLELDTKRLMADIQGQMGNYPECLTLYAEILQTLMKDTKNTSSKVDRQTLFHNMGGFQYQAGLFEEAHDSFQKALNEMNGIKESDSAASILRTKCMIARVMLARNMVDEALPFSIEVHEQTKQMFGGKSRWTLNSLGNVGVAYSKVGRHHDAVEILTQLIENGNSIGMVEMYYFALSLEKLGRFDRSLEILRTLRLDCLEKPNYKVFTIGQVDSALNRIRETRIKKLVLSKVYKFNKLYL